MGGLDRRIGKRQSDHARGHLRTERRDARGPRLVVMRPSIPSIMNRSCQRQTQVFDLPERRMISLVPTPSALERMIAARQACFCEALRSLMIASSRPRTDRVIVMDNSGAHAPDLNGTETGDPNQDSSVRQQTTSMTLPGCSAARVRPAKQSQRGYGRSQRFQAACTSIIPFETLDIQPYSRSQ